MNIAYFITPHGFGHASRACAVMESISQRCPQARFELFTTCPREIFQASLGRQFGYHPVLTDIGMVQRTPLKVDLTATCDQLDQLLPFDDKWVNDLAAQVQQRNCRMVVCDIAPLGIVVARAAGIPNVLIENFTWDWMYNSYPEQRQRLKPHIQYLADIAEQVDYHIQTPPLCRPRKSAIHMPPMSRKPRTSRSQVRKQLRIEDTTSLVLVTMGGVPDRFEFLSKLPNDLDCHVVVPGAQGMSCPNKQVILLPTHSRFFHPDLIAAADALVGKAGYSTVAEAYQAGIPFGHIKRPDSPEAPPLEDFIKKNMPSVSIPAKAYASGEWVSYLPALLRIPRSDQSIENGADTAAELICGLLKATGNAVSQVGENSQTIDAP